MYTIIKHGKNRMYNYQFQCGSCGCQFLCEYDDMERDNKYVGRLKLVDVYKTRCPECKSLITVEEEKLIKVDICAECKGSESE